MSYKIQMGPGIYRDLARTRLLDRQSPEKLFFGQAKISIKIFDFLGVITKYFTNKPSSRTCLKCKLSFLTNRLLNAVSKRN